MPPVVLRREKKSSTGETLSKKPPTVVPIFDNVPPGSKKPGRLTGTLGVLRSPKYELGVLGGLLIMAASRSNCCCC